MRVPDSVSGECEWRSDGAARCGNAASRPVTLRGMWQGCQRQQLVTVVRVVDQLRAGERACQSQLIVTLAERGEIRLGCVRSCYRDCVYRLCLLYSCNRNSSLWLCRNQSKLRPKLLPVVMLSHIYICIKFVFFIDTYCICKTLLTRPC